MEQHLLTVFEAEQLSGRKASTWRKDILQRKVPYVKLGRSVRIPRSAIEAMVKQGWREPIALDQSAVGSDALVTR